MMRRIVCSLLWPVLMSAGFAAHAASPADWQVVQTTSRMTLSPELGELVIRNQRGDIRLRRGEAGFLEVRAVHQFGGAAADHSGWTSTRRGRSLILTAHPDPDRDPRARVDLLIRVPPNLPLRLVSDRGDIEVRRHDADIEAQTKLGDLQIQASASVDLWSRSGRIQLSLFRPNLQGPDPTGALREARVRAPRGNIDLVVVSPDQWHLDLQGCPVFAPTRLAPVGAPTSSHAENEPSPGTCQRVRRGDASAPLLHAHAGGALSLTELPMP